MSDGLETIVILTQTTAHPDDGRPVLDEAADVRDVFVRTTGDGGEGSHWVAGFSAAFISAHGATPSASGDSAAVVDEGEINLQGTEYRLLVGTATKPALDALVDAVGATQVFDGVQAVGEQPLAALLRARTNPSTGRRRVPSLRRIDTQAELSFVAATGVAGHDRVDAALPPGVVRADVEIDDG